MSPPREDPDPGTESGPGAPPAVATAPAPPQRPGPKRARLTPLRTTTPAPPNEPAAVRNSATTSTAPPTTSPALPGSGALAGQAATTPLATAAFGALAALASSYGTGTPAVDPGQPLAPPDIPATARRPAGPFVWDGHMGSGYTAASRSTSSAGNAMGDLNAELTALLGGAAATTGQGRAALAAILAEVDSAVTALGTVPDSAAGRQLLINAMDGALQRAGNVAGQGQSASALTAAKIDALADRYLQESRARSAAAVYSGPSTGPPLARPSGTEGQWIDAALDVLRNHGYDTSQISPADIAAIIQHESGGNPNAINGWDSNAAAGHPSKGLMQTIDSTFYAHALPGHTDIWNPVDNIVAGVRYAIGRYGSVSDVPGIVRLHEGLSYVGY